MILKLLIEPLRDVFIEHEALIVKLTGQRTRCILKPSESKTSFFQAHVVAQGSDSFGNCGEAALLCQPVFKLVFHFIAF